MKCNDCGQHDSQKIIYSCKKCSRCICAKCVGWFEIQDIVDNIFCFPCAQPFLLLEKIIS